MSDSGGTPGREEVARFLQQRRELGGGELFLQDLSRAEVMALIARATAGAGPPRSAASTAADPAGNAAARPAATPASGRSAETSSPSPAAVTPASASPRATRASSATAPAQGDGDDRGALDYDALRESAMACRRCGLAEGRTNVVFSDGSPDARLMVVGEAPGAREDRTGLPFVGPAGKLLDLLLASVDLSRQDTVYICNVLKCRPPGNRNPLPDEIDACSPYLKRQIELVSPEAILAVGTFAGQLLTGRSIALGKLRGEVYSYEGVPLVVTYHPAALLRNRSWTRATWDDLQLLRQILDE